MVPPILNENTDDISPTWTTTSGGTTPSGNEEEKEQERGAGGFFPDGFSPSPSGGLKQDIDDGNETATLGNDDEDADDVVPTLTELYDQEEAGNQKLGGWQVKTNREGKDETGSDDEDEAMDAAAILFGERHWCGHDVLCMSLMSNGRLCGLKMADCKRHGEKRGKGGRGSEGWYLLDPKTSPRQQAAGSYHIVATSMESEATRAAARETTRKQMEQAIQGMTAVNLESSKVVEHPGASKAGVKVMAVKLEPNKEVEHLGTFKPSDRKSKVKVETVDSDDETESPNQHEASASKEGMLEWLETVEAEQKANRDQNKKTKAAAMGRKNLKQGSNLEQDVNLVSRAEVTRIIERERKARESAERKMEKLMAETAKATATTAALNNRYAEELLLLRQHHELGVESDEAPRPSRRAGGITKGKRKTKGKTREDHERQQYSSDSSNSVTSEERGHHYKCKSAEGGYVHRRPSKATRQATDKWYAVVIGKKVGVFNSADKARSYVDGYSNASYKAFRYYNEAIKFYREMRGEVCKGWELESESEDSTSSKEYDPDRNQNDGTRGKKNPPAKQPARVKNLSRGRQREESGNEELSGGNRNGRRGEYDVQQSNSNSERRVGFGLQDVVDPTYAGADKSTLENEVHGINMTHESKAAQLLAPPRSDNDVTKSLLNGALDVAALPGKGLDETNDGEMVLQELSETLAESLRGGEFANGARIKEDGRWNKPSKNHLQTIKGKDDLRETLELLHEIEGEMSQNMENGWRVVLAEHLGWDDDTTELWFRVGVLPRMVRDSLANYRALLLEVEHMCTGAELSAAALVFLKHHSAKLRLIRTHRARTRLQLIWMTYTYLRDARAARFSSQALQGKQTDVLREALLALQAAQTPARTPHNRNNQQRPRDEAGGAPIKCSGCNSRNLHPGIGRRDCPFKSYPSRLARKMGKTADEQLGEGKTKDQAIAKAIQEHAED
jgi:hypothetical protein